MKALEQCFPENGAICEVHDEECYANIVWKDEVVPKPSEELVMSKLKALQDAEPMRLARIKRDELLKQTDKYMTMDFPMTDAQREAMRIYRQTLRDLPQKGITVVPEPPSLKDDAL